MKNESMPNWTLNLWCGVCQKQIRGIECSLGFDGAHIYTAHCHGDTESFELTREDLIGFEMIEPMSQRYYFFDGRARLPSPGALLADLSSG